MDMILTNIGEELASNGFLTGVFPKVTRVSFGDGNGNMVIPDKTMTSLVHQIQNGIGTVLARLANPNRLYIYTQIPATIGGITIREVGLFTEDNTLIAIGGNFEKIKPPVNESTEKFDFYITVPISSTQDITVEFSNDNLYASQEAIDVIATQEEVNRLAIDVIANAEEDNRAALQDIKVNLLPLKLNIKDVVNTLTSTLTDKPLSAAQGKVLKTLIDNINKVLLSDNTTLDSMQELVDFIEMNRKTLNTLGISSIAGLQNALNGKLNITDNATSASKLRMDVSGTTCAALFSNTSPNYTSMKEVNGYADAPNGGWWFIHSIRHSNASSLWGTQLAYGWENNATIVYQRNVSNGVWSSWVNTSMIRGMIILWSGSISSIPNGWYLCNGQNGTPDLRNKFVYGASTDNNVGGTGGSKDAVVVSHNHSASSDSQGNHAHTAWTDSQGYHQHTGLVQGGGGAHAVTNVGDQPIYIANSYTGVAGGHGHNIGMNEAGIHAHNITVNSNGESGIDKNLPPFMLLAYIMKG